MSKTGVVGDGAFVDLSYKRINNFKYCIHTQLHFKKIRKWKVTGGDFFLDECRKEKLFQDLPTTLFGLLAITWLYAN